ncbi:MAG: hypothetical protein JWO36_7011 [Myxococcales bacterium]|nr:hypothetical protein [Myxococcales bacterium]
MMQKWMVAVLVVAACSSKSRLDDKPAPKDARTDPNPTKSLDLPTGAGIAHLENPVVQLPKQDSFVILEAGKGPASLLRYTPAPGTVMFHAETSLKSRHLSARKWSDLSSLPTIREGFAITVDADASRPLALRPLPGEVVGKTSKDAEQYLAGWRAIQSRRFSIALDNRGQLGAITFNDDPTMARSTEDRDELLQRLLAAVVPVPAEPISVGTSWRVVTLLRQRPALVKQSATYTLVSRTPTSWKIAIKLQRIGEEQVITDAGLPKGAAANLIALVRRFEGTVDIDPKRPFPSGKLSVTSTIHVRIAMPDNAIDEQIFEDAGTVVLSTTDN